MEDFFEDVQQKADQESQTLYIKFFANGATKETCTIAADRRFDELWKLKKRLLKKLKYKNYKSEKLQSEVRIFTVKGIELGEYDMEDLFQ